MKNDLPVGDFDVHLLCKLPSVFHNSPFRNLTIFSSF